MDVLAVFEISLDHRQLCFYFRLLLFFRQVLKSLFLVSPSKIGFNHSMSKVPLHASSFDFHGLSL